MCYDKSCAPQADDFDDKELNNLICPSIDFAFSAHVKSAYD